MANKNLFNAIKVPMPKSSRFDLSHDVKFSLEMGILTPVLCMEAIPGDRVKIGSETLVRLAPMVAPVMHRVNVFVHYFFIPYRIMWDGWETWITDPSSALTHPYMQYNDQDFGIGSLADYLGLPQVAVAAGAPNVSAFPFCAYQKVYNEYYRDENLQAGIANDIAPAGGLQTATDFHRLRRRAWEHDYFTSALPWTQKGDPVTIPLGDFQDTPVYANHLSSPGVDSFLTGTNYNVHVESTVDGPDHPMGDNTLYAETSGLSLQAATINDLRMAERLQRWEELNARLGSRYTEYVRRFGVTSPDARLQRPEYITGQQSPVVISEVLNTAGVDELPQGNMAGHGISVGSGRGGYYQALEHGLILGIMSVMPRTAYQQGVPRMFSKFDQFDYFDPMFANLGEQAVLNKEIYVESAEPDGTFGYNPRYSEYKYMPNRVAGAFKTSLDYWHMGRKFDSEPALNSDFIECNPTKRIFAVTDPEVDSLYAHHLNKISASRRMPYFGTPSW